MEIFFLENGIKRKGKKQICVHCSKEFLCRLNSNRKYCSSECLHKSQQKRIEVLCDGCGKKVYKRPSKIGIGKHNLNFCSRQCKDNSQRIDGNCPQIRPPHYGTGRLVYQTIAYNNYDAKCIDCGNDREYLLHVHHIDGNHSNNVKENLEIVCSNCHIKRHLKLVDGKWLYDNMALTDRKILKTIL